MLELLEMCHETAIVVTWFCSHELTEAMLTCTRVDPLSCMGEGLKRLHLSLRADVWAHYHVWGEGLIKLHLSLELTVNIGARMEGFIFFSGVAADKLPMFQ